MKSNSFASLRFAVALAPCALLNCAQAQQTTSPDSPIAMSKTNLKAPTGVEILARLRPAHPRLLADSQTFERLKARVQTEAWAKDWFARVRRDADKMLDAPPSRYEIPDGLRLLATSRRVLDRATTLGMAFRLSGEIKYRDRLWSELEAAANFPDWNPKHFLDVGEMTNAFAVAYDWLYADWTPAQRAVLSAAIEKNGLQPALEAYRGKSKFGWWVRVHHNWNQVCNGGIGMGALAIADEKPALCGEILQNVVANLPFAMREFAPDGAWSEGPGYWDYATKYNVAILAGFDSALGTDYGLSDIPGFSKTGDFPLYISGPNDLAFNYADSGERAPRPAQLLWMAKRFGHPEWAAFARPERTSDPLAGLWFDAAANRAGDKTVAPPTTKYFRGAEVVTMRGAWNDAQTTFLGFKAGDNKANHAHLDLGTWVMDALGERWIFNMQGDDYNLPGYFGKQRWTYYRLRAEGQNTLVFNPSLTPDQEPSAEAKIERFGQAAKHQFALADITMAYAKNATSVKRGIELEAGRDVLLQDEIKTDAPADLWWFAHTRAQITLDETGKIATLTIKDKKLTARILSPLGARFEVRDATPLPSAPQPPKQNPNDGARKLAIHLPAAQNETIAIWFSPQTPQNNALTAPIVRPLAKW